MVCRMKLPGRHLRMLVAIFTLNILTTFASIAHSVFSLLHMNQASFIAGNAQVCFQHFFHSPSMLLTRISNQCATSLFVCNLLVLVTFLYHRIRGNDEETVSEHPETVTQSRARRPPTDPSRPAIRRIELSVLSIKNRSTGAAHLRAIHGDAPPPRPCELSPSSKFPDLLPRRHPPEMMIESHPRLTTYQKSLMPLACNLSATSTFPDLQIIREDGQLVPSSPSSLQVQQKREDEAHMYRIDER